MEANNTQETEIDTMIDELDTKIERLSEDPKTVSDVSVDVDETTNIINNIISDDEPYKDQPEVNLESEIINKLNSMSPQERNKIFERIAKLKQVNPHDKKFTTCENNDRTELLRKYRERKEQLAMKRMTKRRIVEIKDGFMDKLMKTQMDVKDVPNVQDIQDNKEEQNDEIKNKEGENLNNNANIENLKVQNNTFGSEDEPKDTMIDNAVKKKKKLTKAQRKQRQKLNK